MPGCAKREGCYYGKETVSDRGDGTADHRGCAHAVPRLRRKGHPGECPPHQQSLQLEQGLQGVFCGQGTAQPRHPADPQGGGLRRGLLFPDRADAQRGLRLYRPRHHVLLQPDPCGGYEEGLRAGCLHQSGRCHHGGVSGAGGWCAAGDLLPL